MKTSAVALALLTLKASGTEYSITRTLAEPVEYTLITLTDINWKLSVSSEYDEDTGKEWL